MTESNRASRRAQDTLVLLGLGIAGLLLAVGGTLLPVPMLALIGLPLSIAAALLFAVLALGLGGFEVPWWRQLIGLATFAGGLYLFGHGYLHGLGTIAEHFLGRAGAPPLSALLGSVPWLAGGASALGASVILRRPGADGVSPGIGLAIVGSLSAALGWGLLIVLAILGLPLGA
ncbi:MAG: hypothetical protein AB7S26_32970 [Sandaracinaceae bacterium]